MPKRSNLFQDVVARVQHHLADGATIEESAMLTSRATGELREVDVVVRGVLGGHPIGIGVEARGSTGRPADIQWVERMLGKHADLPTDKLVLVSETGFTKPALNRAEAEAVLAIAPVDLGGGDPTFKFVNNIRNMWVKGYSIRPTSIQITSLPGMGPALDHLLGRPHHQIDLTTADGRRLCSFGEWVTHQLNAHAEQAAGQLGDVVEGARGEAVLEASSPEATVDGVVEQLYLSLPGGDESVERYPIKHVRIAGMIHVEVNHVPLRHRQLRDVNATSGQFTIDGKHVSFVATSHNGTERTTMRVYDSSSTWRELQGPSIDGSAAIENESSSQTAE